MRVEDLYLLKHKRLYQSSYDYMKKKYENREDKDNIFGVGMTDTEFVNILIQELLGKDWYVVDPLGREQINEIACYTILERFSPKIKGKGEQK